MLDVDILGLKVENWIVSQSYWSLVIFFQQNDKRPVKLASFPTLNILVFVNVSYTNRDLDEGVLLVGLEESQLYKQQT